MVYDPNWPCHFRSSLTKWNEEVGQKIENKIPFDNALGWTDITIVPKCKLCRVIRKFDCRGCAVPDNYLHKAVPGGDLFKKFLNTMRVSVGGSFEPNPSPDWSEAERLRVSIFFQIKKKYTSTCDKVEGVE